MMKFIPPSLQIKSPQEGTGAAIVVGGTKKEWPGDPIVCGIKGLGKQIYFRIS